MFDLNDKYFHQSLDTLMDISASKKNQSQHEFVFRSVSTKRHSHVIAAVDGSNISIQGNGFTIAAIRTGFLIYQNERVNKDLSKPGEIELYTLINSKDVETNYLAVFNQMYLDIVGEVPTEFIEFDKIQDRIRSLKEWGEIQHLVHQLSAGDIIIFDGSLISGSMSTSDEFFSNLLETAKEKGISLVGLSKDTSMMAKNVPVPMLLREAAKQQGIETNWYVEWDEHELKHHAVLALEKTYFVKFTKAKDLIFRLDVVHPEDIMFEEVFKRVQADCYDDYTMGYPYSMQQIHNTVLISKLDKDHIFYELKSKWIQAGKDMKEFDELFFNYHKQLDIIARGR